MPAGRTIGQLRKEGLVGAADPWISYAAPDVLTWPTALAPAAQELCDSAADLVLSTNGLSR